MEEFTPQEIAKSLHLLRHAKGWTLRQLERESGMPVNTILAYQSLRRRPPLAAVERLLIAMG
jgi:transcriptional regulator with XRE-family HTH domain